MECNLINVVTVQSPIYSWKLDGITVIKNGIFTENIRDVRPELLNIFPNPIQIFDENEIKIFVEPLRSSFYSQADPLTCYGYNINASLEGILYYITSGTWTCEVESSFGNISSDSIVINEPGKILYS